MSREMTKRQQAEVTRRQQQETIVPAADIWETEDAIMIQMDMPGVSKDNVEVKVERDTLQVDGKPGTAPQATAIYTEQRQAEFRREFRLSDDLDREKIHAEMNAGVLTLRIAKAEEVKPRRIQIAAAG